ncbi:MAG: hypothetical protein RMI90_14790, partial [Thermoguttaceae bacterium]|nr:hypothetical protein [Thermoguttaceae bacterium]
MAKILQKRDWLWTCRNAGIRCWRSFRISICRVLPAASLAFALWVGSRFELVLEPPGQAEAGVVPFQATEASPETNLLCSKDPLETKELFDGRSLAGWNVLDELAFKTHGKVEV